MIKTLRDMAQGARTQLNNELGPEFADFDLSSLNPRTAIKNALLGDDDFGAMNPKNAIQRALRGEDDPAPSAKPNPIDLSKPAPQTPPLATGGPAPYDTDAT